MHQGAVEYSMFIVVSGRVHCGRAFCSDACLPEVGIMYFCVLQAPRMSMLVISRTKIRWGHSSPHIGQT